MPSKTAKPIPKDFNAWILMYFRQVDEGLDDQALEGVSELFEDKYTRFRESVETQLDNARKLPELQAIVDTGIREAEAEHSTALQASESKVSTKHVAAAVARLKALLKELKPGLDKLRKVIEASLKETYDTAMESSLELRRNPNDSRDAVRTCLKNWDLIGARSALATFEADVNRAKPLDMRELGRVEELHGTAKLQNAAFARNTHQALLAARRIINDDGRLVVDFEKDIKGKPDNKLTATERILKSLSDLPTFESSDLLTVSNEIAESRHSDLPQSVHALRTLKQLQTDKELRKAVKKIKAPGDQNSDAANLIRATLGLKSRADVTDADARQAALSALLFQVRQGAVGSCFATASAARVQQNRPQQFLADMQELFSSGKLKRTMEFQGREIEVEVPLNPDMLKSPLENSVQVQRVNSNLHLAPDMIAALDAAGIPDEEQQLAIENAARELRCRRALNAALDRIETTLSPPNTRKSILDETLKVLREDPAKSIQEALEGTLSKRGFVLGPRVLTRKVTCQYDDATGSDDFRPDEILEQVVRSRCPEKDLKKSLKAARDAFLGQQDNRVLRAWEYTIATMVEKMPGVSSKGDKLKQALARSVRKEVDRIAAQLGSGRNPVERGRLTTIGSALSRQFEKAVDAEIDSRYDANVQNAKQSVAPDGHSSEGGFNLYFRDGKIDGQARLAEVVDELFTSVQQAAYGTAGEPDRGYARAIRDRLVNAAGGNDFGRDVVAETGDPQNVVHPWGIAGGGDTDLLLQLYEDQKQPLQSASRRAPNAESLAGFLIDTLRDMNLGSRLAPGPESELASVPVRAVGNHAFNLKPGSPLLLSILKGDKKTTAVLNEFKKLEKAKNAKRLAATVELTIPPQGVVLKMMRQAGALYGNYMNGAARANFESEFTNRLQAKKAGSEDSISLAVVRTVIDEAIEATTGTFLVAIPAHVDRDKQNAADLVAPIILEDVVPGNEVPLLIDAAIRKLKVPEQKCEAIRAKLLPVLTGEAVTKSVIEEALTKELEAAKVKVDKDRITQALNEPRGLVFADANWGQGDHMVHFSMVVNPMTQEMELWQMNEDGTEMSKINQNAWIKDTDWRVFTNTAQYSGTQGDEEWESRRGDLRRQLEECVMTERGDIGELQRTLEFADHKYSSGDRQAGMMSLDKLDRLLKAAGKKKGLDWNNVAHKKKDRAQAELSLLFQPVGTWLVRPGSSDPFVISVRDSVGVTHYNESSYKKSGETWTLAAIMSNRGKEKMLSPGVRTPKVNRGKLTQDQAEQLLNAQPNGTWILCDIESLGGRVVSVVNDSAIQHRTTGKSDLEIVNTQGPDKMYTG